MCSVQSLWSYHNATVAQILQVSLMLFIHYFSDAINVFCTAIISTTAVPTGLIVPVSEQLYSAVKNGDKQEIREVLKVATRNDVNQGGKVRATFK